MSDTASFPFLTTYDPPGTSEGTLDPMGLYQISEQLAVQLVPAVRERMQRIRFLTAMAVGALVTQDVEDEPPQRDASPYLIWEWLVVEALIRALREDPQIWGVAGTQVGRRAIDEYGHLDTRSYLKTPRIFGFNGVYKRLALHLGLVDVHLAPGTNAEGLADAWARGLGRAGLSDVRPLLNRWTEAVRRSRSEKPPRTSVGWSSDGWGELAEAFAPGGAKAREKRHLRDLLHATDERRLGAFSTIWELQDGFDEDTFQEEALHARLQERQPGYRPLVEAIRVYEAFARGLQDAFDVLKFAATGRDALGFQVTDVARDLDFKRSVKGLHERFEAACQALGEVTLANQSPQALFRERFSAFAEPLDPGACALAICKHHKTIQDGKSASGKRPWFDDIGPGRIYVRHAYREKRREIAPDRYVNAYRSRPIRRFHGDLQ